MAILLIQITIDFQFQDVFIYLYTGSPPPFLYHITSIGGFFDDGADVLQNRFATPPNTLALCEVLKIGALSLVADFTSAVT